MEWEGDGELPEPLPEPLTEPQDSGGVVDTNARVCLLPFSPPHAGNESRRSATAAQRALRG